MTDTAQAYVPVYKVRWGNITAAIMFTLVFFIGTFILYLVYTRGEAVTNKGVFYQYYSPLLGYFVVASICQSHYFRTSPTPTLHYGIRYFVSIGAALILFASNVLIFDALGIHNDDWMRGHFLWILFGFYMFGFDDFLFAARLSKPLKHDPLKAALWYTVIWIMWGAMTVWGFIGDGEKFNHFAGHYQWSVILILIFAVQWKDIIPEFPKFWTGFRNPYLLGIALTLITAIGGYLIGEALFSLNQWRFPEITDNDNWHHVLYQGTYPLTPIIIFGLYTRDLAIGQYIVLPIHLAGIKNVWVRTLARTMEVVVGAFALYLFFHLMLMPTEFLYVATDAHVPHPYKWYKSIDLYWNFTVSILALTWHWFTARYGFVVPKKV